uniref:G_PROTEIN_RECEP_F1_2 domain-containing protein n=1 Tax=Steinernema glaseri TaxID=37863 RepID=A0A1I8A196_9BILA
MLPTRLFSTQLSYEATNQLLLFSMSMAQSYEHLYNVVLHISVAIHMPVKLFAMFIMLKYTPAPMRYSSYFILNSLLWNFGANIITTFVHLYPLYPAECFRFDGVLNYVSFLDNEIFSHVMCLLLFCCLVNAVMAHTLVFAYRFFLFKFIKSMKPYRSFMVGLVYHGVTAFVTAILYYRWVVLKKEYPFRTEMPLDSRFLFCFKPEGLEKTMISFAAITVVVVAALLSLIFSLLLLWAIRKEEGKMEKKQLDTHKRILKILLIISTPPVFLAALPFIIAIYTVIEPHARFATYTFLVAFVILTNHGTLYAIVLILVLKSYREAARNVLFLFKTKLWKDQFVRQVQVVRTV